MGGLRGPNWDYVEGLMHGRNTLHVKCKFCGHEFYNNATQNKEHLFKASINVLACSNPPLNLSSKLYNYASKLTNKLVLMAAKSTQKCNTKIAEKCMYKVSNVSIFGENADAKHMHLLIDSEYIVRINFCISPTIPNPALGSRQSSKNKSPIPRALDNSTTLELHLKWT